MESRINNIGIISISACIIALVIIIASIAKISDKHNEKLIYAMESKIEYYAKRCYLENNCVNEITLNELYEKKYLTEVVNPVTKEILDGNLKINYIDDQIIIEWN
ncbi:MAG: hypothetical protein J1F35_00685 [Erysipelotrichales bacterium]|nr:hypothetical protein [Erysipelotrichales bacterium]